MSDYDVPYTVFDALIDYSYAAGVLTLDIRNDTASPYAYTLSDLCFNVSSGVTGMSILNDGSLTHTSLTTNQHGGPLAYSTTSSTSARGTTGFSRATARL